MRLPAPFLALPWLMLARLATGCGPDPCEIAFRVYVVDGPVWEQLADAAGNPDVTTNGCQTTCEWLAGRTDAGGLADSGQPPPPARLVVSGCARSSPGQTPMYVSCSFGRACAR
jgi:hypothetical protein